MNPLSLIHRTLMAIGAICLGWCGLAVLDAQLYERLGAARLNMVMGSVSAADASAPGYAKRARAEAAASGLIGRIEIPRVSLSAIVAEGEEESTLRRAVGHLPGTAFPGEKGNVVLAGHRETHFRPLRQVRAGDQILVGTPDGRFEYRVVSTSVVGPSAMHVIDDQDHPTLTLVTCYPFNYVGPAPLRYVVRAKKLEPAGASSPGAKTAKKKVRAAR